MEKNREGSRRDKNIEIKDPRGREVLEKDEPEIDETPAEFFEQPIVPKGKWARDKFGDEHFAGGDIDQGKIQLGRKREVPKDRKGKR